MFFPDSDIYINYTSKPNSINVTTFYDIFDGYYHLQLSFNLTVLKFKERNHTSSINTAPTFVYVYKNKMYPILTSLTYKYIADLPKNVTNLPKIWDKEENNVTLTHNSD
jgi:hypothetical protein